MIAGLTFAKNPKRKIAIVGTAPDWTRAPFDDPTWEIWACNQFALDNVPRCERIFEIHRRWNEDDRESPDKDYLDRLKKVRLPQKVYSIIPIGGKANVVLDRDAMFKKYGSTWFSSSFSYMFALAFDEGVSEIGLWGMGMESREEYIVQFAGVRHFVDLGRALGVKMLIPDYSLFAREPSPYPDRFETSLALILESKAQRIQKLVHQQSAKLEAEKVRAYQAQGAINWRVNNLGSDVETLGDDLKDCRQLFENVELLKENVATLKGELWATQHYKRLFVWNVIPPDMGEETMADIQDCGPV